MGKSDYVDYHDREWGVPVHDDLLLFEFLMLESTQTGLSVVHHSTLRKRENYRQNFAGFDPRKVARFSETRVERVLKDPGIVRNRLKVQNAVINARCFVEVQQEFGSFDAYVWDFVDGHPIVNTPCGLDDYPVTTPQSDARSQDLKRRDFKSVGSTII